MGDIIPLTARPQNIRPRRLSREFVWATDLMFELNDEGLGGEARLGHTLVRSSFPNDECLIGYLAWVELGGLAFNLQHRQRPKIMIKERYYQEYGIDPESSFYRIYTLQEMVTAMLTSNNYGPWNDAEVNGIRCPRKNERVF
jgi:hypothetical protein